MTLRFAYPADDSAPRPFLVVDGALPRARVLSHWPGTRTPARYRAETTTEMALLLAADPDRESFLDGIAAVTNTHCDLDGVLSTWAVLHPAEALAHRPELVAAARAGDFLEWTTPSAVYLELAFEECEEKQIGPDGRDLPGSEPVEREREIYSSFHARLPGLLLDPFPCPPLGDERWALLLESLRMARTGALTVREMPEALLTVQETTRPIERRVRWAFAANPRVLHIEWGKDGIRVRLEYQQWTWFDTPRRGRRFRRDLGPLATHLNEEEPGEGRWRFDGVERLAPRLWCAAPGGRETPTSIPPERIEALLVDELRRTGPGADRRR